MKVKEALEILKQLPPNKEVKLVFEKDNSQSDEDDPCYGHHSRFGGSSDIEGQPGSSCGISRR